MPSNKYPDTEGFAYSFSRAELTVGPRIYTAISGVNADQPTEEGVVKGTRAFPLKRTVGTMGLGDGSLTFSDEGERSSFIISLGDFWREKTWQLMWILTAPGMPNIKKVAKGCRCLSEPIADEEGPDPLGGDVTFSYMYLTVNGKVPHRGLSGGTGVPGLSGGGGGVSL